jgi:hypothetical protein
MTGEARAAHPLALDLPLAEAHGLRSIQFESSLPIPKKNRQRKLS